MLTGEPPWKDHNLTGLVQLHMLLERWTAGPPNYDESKVTPEAKQCLQMFFIKDENARPTVAEMLNCRFLQADEEENDDSLEYSTEEVLGNDRPKVLGFGDSGVLSGLKEQMVRAVTRSSYKGPNDEINCDESPSQYIDQKLQQRHARQVRTVADVEADRSPKSTASPAR